MHYRKVGTSGIEASAIGLGTWAMGGWMWGGAEEADSVSAIHAALDSGVNLIDTAPVYGFGRSEEIVGAAIRDRREQVVLATKCGLIWHKEKGQFFFASDEHHPTNEGQIQVYRCLAPDTIRYEVEESLRRLKTDYIDIYQTHWQEESTPVSWTMQTLLELKDEGKIRAIGCSNAGPAQMTSYRDNGVLDVDQELYSMLDRQHEEKNLPYVRKRNMAFFAYSPLAQGLLTGRIGPDRLFDEGDQRNSKAQFSVENRRAVQRLLRQFQPVAEGHQITLSQLVLAWTIAQSGCSHVLVGARTAEQAVENSGAGGVVLTQEELQIIDGALEIFARERVDES